MRKPSSSPSGFAPRLDPLQKERENMNTLERIAQAGIVPVVVLEDAANAVPTARALCAGGVDVMEITFRTAAAAQSIRAVAADCPEMLVGAGTVVTLDQCQEAVAAGAKFIVAPGFDAEVVRWCVENEVPVVPGCVTPSEIMAAMKLGLRVVKFFPASVYGGISAMKALSGPFPGISFIPTGGINAQNIGEYLRAPFIHAVGGSWICTAKDIAEQRFSTITALCQDARLAMLGYEVAHVGVNMPDADSSARLCETLEGAFGFGTRLGNSSNFAGDGIEVMKSAYLGEKGHIAIHTNRVELAVADLARQGYRVLPDTAKYKKGRMTAIYLEGEMGGFAIHLLQK